MTEPATGKHTSQLWDPHKMYTVSAEELKAIEQRKEMRQALRAEWQKKLSNPYTKAEGGYIFDPAVQRFMAMKATRFDHFRATPKSGLYLFLLYILPVGGMAYFINKSRTENEKKYRSGEVLWKDRPNLNRYIWS